MIARRGFTLLELMLALAGAVLLAGLVLTVYHVVLRATGEQAEWRQNVYPISSAMELLAQDLACAAVPLGLTNAPLVFEQAPNDGFMLHLFTALPSDASANGQIYRLAEVRWRLTNSPNDLIREKRFFRLPNADANAATTDLWRNVGNLRLEFLTETGWSSIWNNPTNTGSPAQLPGAARIQWQSPCAGHRTEMEVFIPAAQTVVVSNSP